MKIIDRTEMNLRFVHTADNFILSIRIKTPPTNRRVFIEDEKHYLAFFNIRLADFLCEIYRSGLFITHTHTHDDFSLITFVRN